MLFSGNGSTGCKGNEKGSNFFHKRGSGNKFRGNQRGFGNQNNHKRNQNNNESQDEGYLKRSNQIGFNQSRARDHLGLSDDGYRSSRGPPRSRKGSSGYSSDGNWRGTSTDRQRNQSQPPAPSTSFSGAQAVFSLINKESSIKDKPDGARKQDVRPNHREQNSRKREVNSYEDISMKGQSSNQRRNFHKKPKVMRQQTDKQNRGKVLNVRTVRLYVLLLF